MSEIGETPKDTRITKARIRAGSIMELRRTRKGLPENLEENRHLEVPVVVKIAYEEFKDDIGNVFGTEHLRGDLLHHGTGAMKYAGDKYGDGVSEQIQYPLDNIVSEGLMPQLDIFSMEGPMHSTSLAFSWEYAKWYATMCQDPNRSLAWEYGNRDNWGAYFLYRTLVDFRNIKHIPSISKRIGRRTIDKLVGKDRQRVPNRAHKWISATSREITEDSRLNEILRAKTDIPGNFGAVLTVNESDAPAVKMGPGDAYERRTQSPITSDKFVALSVPLDQVDTYRNITDSLGYKFPVLPIEAVDYHMRKFPFDEIVRPEKYGTKNQA